MRPSVFAFALAGALSWASAASAGADLVKKGPYLQHVTSTSVDLRLELVAPGLAAVEVWADESPGSNSGSRGVGVSAGHGWQFHSLHVGGLTAATHYHYELRVGEGAPILGTFVTAPAPASHEPFTFVIYGDDRSDGPAHERVVSAIAKESFDFLVNTGDFVVAGSDEAGWQSFFDIEEPLLREHCVFACVGNHELNNDTAASHFERYFGPGDGIPNSKGPKVLHGTFRWGRARFFMLNAFDDWGRGPERGWLENELAKSDHETGIDLRVVVMHQGLYAAGPHGGSKAMQAAHIDDLLRAHHVDLVIAGHDHIYERGDADGLKYLVSGGGGAPLYRDLTPLPSTRKVEATYHYVLATVSDQGLSLVAKRPDGSTVDTCSFAFGSYWACDPPPPPMPVAPPASQSKRSRCGCDVPGVTADSSWSACIALGLAGALVRRRQGRRVP